MADFDDKPPQYYKAQPQPGGSRAPMVIACCLVVTFLACGGLCAGVVFVGYRFVAEVAPEVGEAFRKVAASFQPFADAMEKLRTDPVVAERLGEPLEESFPSDFQVHTSNDEGDADLTFSIKGPQGSADVRIKAVQEDEIWRLTELTVTFEDGTTLDGLRAREPPEQPDQPPPAEQNSEEAKKEPVLPEAEEDADK